ncbi:peptidase M48 [Leptolyngbyaceae cyanobacterium CCMR0082]|uniref:Peptidase M48 n=2 Tax=Adonisia turfae TaxID=2950184 RepID=A0A6M0S090_9CYAN|nr:M48 family metallopeptidase [Adonisia turfae]MDV3350872.1 M48 family metallopeptidase [Leptothoe sp. LEGE 181152]NEZ58893.1 peptidase M48 [Adonisia turfae CCMR0081]NEZ61889.1 peptidase M48 [Adonisia turfae CCMR0082]
MSNAFLRWGNRWQRRLAYGLMAFFVTLSFGVFTPRPATAGLLDIILPTIQVFQITNMSDEQEVSLGKQVNQQLLSSSFRLHRDSSLTAYVDQIGQSLIPHSDRPDIPYVFQVVEDDSINAFATMGGYVYITTGLLAAADNEAEVAGVLGHEIGHIAEKHALDQMRDVAIAQGVAGAFGLSRNQMVGIAVDVALTLPNSRRDELVADEHGFVTMGEAGYDQTGMATLMQKLDSGNSPPAIFSTHPNPRDRVVRLQQMDNESAIPSATAGTDTTAYSSRVSSLR